MSSINAGSVRAQAEAREQDEKRQQERKKAAIVMITRHLFDHGYLDASETLQNESGVSLQKYDTADNIDLIQVIQEFEDFYEFKFGRKPKLFKKIAEADGGGSTAARGLGSASRKNSTHLPRIPSGSSSSGGPPPSGSTRKKRHDSAASEKPDKHDSESLAGDESTPRDDAMSVGGQKIEGGGKDKRSSSSSTRGAVQSDPTTTLIAGGKLGVPKALLDKARGAGPGGAQSPLDEGKDDDFWEGRMLKPLPDFGYNSELRELATVISRDIIAENPNVHWDDIADLDKAKQLLKEAIVMPIRYPQFFTGLLKPWKGVLLYGPPGTGKTMLAKAVATECKTTFFNISASSIVSKWRGDSEKLVRVLFDLARHHRPSTIFLDEIDAIMSQRESSGGNEHEGSRRMKTELLIQMDGLSKSTEQVFVLAASNLPWDLDAALLRRLEKRILVSLPNKRARRILFEHNLSSQVAVPLDFDTLSDKTEGYSGSDIVLVCKEAAMRPLRRMMAKLEDPAFAKSMENKEQSLRLEMVTQEDVDAALACTRPSARMFSEKYTTWESEYGSV